MTLPFPGSVTWNCLYAPETHLPVALLYQAEIIKRGVNLPLIYAVHVCISSLLRLIWDMRHTLILP